ncbi:MAG: SCO family protein [Proteobacteria bacterium]|nr:SCO family protein [Pseudomonadota bacterium]
MPARAFAALALALVVASLPAVARAHSLAEFEAALGAREKYFQPIDKDAPDFALADAAGRPLRLAGLHGKVVVLNFIYAACRDICPLHMQRIAEIQHMVNQTPMRAQVAFITVTTDPANDTPDVLRAYGARHALDLANWTFLTTAAGQPEDATRKLAQRFGHRFTRQADGYQLHGIVTHVIDQQGRWRANFHGLKFDPANLVVFVNALVNDVHDQRAPSDPGLWGRIKGLFGS